MNKILAALLLFLVVDNAAAKDYLVKSEKEFNDIVDLLVAGDEVIVAKGIYKPWSVTLSASGTKEKPILIRSIKPGLALFSGEVAEPVFQLTGTYIQLKGFTFEGCSISKSDGNKGVLVEIKNSNFCSILACTFTKNRAKTQFTPLVVISGKGSGNSVRNCKFESNIDNQDIQVKVTATNNPTNTVIQNNLFLTKTKVSWANGNGGECVQIGQDPVLMGNIVATTLVKKNRFIRCNAEAEIISNKSSDNRYVKNYFEDCDGELVMRGGHNCQIKGNEFNGGFGGIRVNGTGHTIVNNKISVDSTGIRLMYGMATGINEIGFYIAASNCMINNNIIKNAAIGILVGDSKNEDWTGKFDTKRYPSRVKRDIAPVDNQLLRNKFKKVRATVIYTSKL